MRTFLISSIIFAAVQLHAQTLTQSFNEPAIGDVDKNYKLDTSAYTGGLPVALTGSNVVWDFTKLSGTFPVIFDSIKAPSAAKGGSNFPGASFAQQRDGIFSFFKSESIPQQTEVLGAYSPSLAITFSNSAIIATYPVSFGYTHSDPVSGTFTYVSTNTTKGNCNGKIDVFADAIGTINFPNNVSFQNVLLLRSVEQLTMGTSGFPAPIGSISQKIYSFYVPGKKFPVLSIQYQKYQLFVGTPTITAIAYGNFAYFTVVGLNEQHSDRQVTVYPNPFHDRLFASHETDKNGTDLLLYSVSGMLIQKANSAEELDVATLPVGMYILETRSGGIVNRQKIIKN